MDTIISNVLLFLKDCGLSTTLEVLSLELESLHILSPETKSTKQNNRPSLQSLNVNLREKLHMLINNRNLDASNYPHLFNLLKMPNKNNQQTKNSNKVVFSSPKAKRLNGLKIENKGINNLAANLIDNNSRNDIKKSDLSNKDEANFSFQDTPCRSQSQMVLEPVSKLSGDNREYRNVQSLGNLKKNTDRSSKSNVDVFSGDYDSEVGELDSVSYKDNRDYQPFFANEGKMNSYPKVWYGPIRAKRIYCFFR